MFNKMFPYGKLVVFTCLVFSQYIQNFIVFYRTRVFSKVCIHGCLHILKSGVTRLCFLRACLKYTQINWTLWYLPFKEFQKTFKESTMGFDDYTIKNSNQI